MIYKFPEGFKWGSATSAHQIEGDNHNDWSIWEQSESRIKNLESRGLNPEDFISGKACDSYNRYREDFDIAKKLDQNIHRFSIEWSRIEPEEGRFDEKEMQHYINIVKSLKDRGIEPMVTLWHFTNPIWFADKGGFLNKRSPEYFTRYAGYVADKLKGQVRLWITFNEGTDIYSSHSYLTAKWPPQHRNIFEWRRVSRNIVRAHVSAYKEIKNIYGQSPFDSESVEVEPQGFSEGQPRENQTSHNTIMQHHSISHNRDTLCNDKSSHNVSAGMAVRNTWSVGGNNFYERIIGKIYNYYRNLFFWAKAFPYYDFMGLNYYEIDRRVPGSYKTLPKQNWWMEEMNWEIYPKGVYYAISQLKKFKKPIYITENGTADAKDVVREKFIKEHLKWVWQAIQDGADVRGYLYWSLLDNFELDHGYAGRFGLVEVDYNTFERRIRPSALEYAKICKENQLDI